MVKQKVEEDSDLPVEDVFPPWKEWGDRCTKLFSYYRTRRAIMAGTALWDFSRAELESNRFLEPWTFNIYQSALSALPTILIIQVLSFFGIKDEVTVFWFNELGPTLFEYFNQIHSFLNPLLAPLILGVTCFGAARGSLEPGDRSKERLARARRVYLCYDGAFGLWSQAILSFGITLYTYSPTIKMGMLAVPIVGMVGIASWRQEVITARLIPGALFALNGYDWELPKKLSMYGRDRNSARWRRYMLLSVYAGVGATILLKGMFYLISVVGAFALEFLQHSVIHLVR